MFKRLYGLMGKDEKASYQKVLALEINSYLHKMYSVMKHKSKLSPSSVSLHEIHMKHASLGATKMWEFLPNARAKAAKGDVGSIVVVTRGLDDNHVRKQRALFIAAEWYVYQSFASHPDERLYGLITCQNQYKDMVKRVFGMRNAHDLRDQAMRYIIEEIGEHKLAQSFGDGWFISIAKLKKHDQEIAAALGSTEATFNEIFRKQDQKFSSRMLLQEENLIRKELEDINHLIRLLKKHGSKRHPKHLDKLVDLHIANLETFRKYLMQILSNLDRWTIIDKKEHRKLKKRNISREDMHRLLADEARAEQVDINKVHLVFDHFKKEKINILTDLEMLDRLSE
ncbi:MAG: hypothetical protein V1729_02495, partial [Candidatus Woesearchaeota archaeon]